MKISPEPLSPLRNWRELWQPETTGYQQTFNEQISIHVEGWRQQKKAGQTWFSHLFGRTAHR